MMTEPLHHLLLTISPTFTPTCRHRIPLQEVMTPTDHLIDRGQHSHPPDIQGTTMRTLRIMQAQEWQAIAETLDRPADRQEDHQEDHPTDHLTMILIILVMADPMKMADKGTMEVKGEEWRCWQGLWWMVNGSRPSRPAH